MMSDRDTLEKKKHLLQETFSLMTTAWPTCTRVRRECYARQTPRFDSWMNVSKRRTSEE